MNYEILIYGYTVTYPIWESGKIWIVMNKEILIYNI